MKCDIYKPSIGMKHDLYEANLVKIGSYPLGIAFLIEFGLLPGMTNSDLRDLRVYGNLRLKMELWVWMDVLPVSSDPIRPLPHSGWGIRIFQVRGRDHGELYKKFRDRGGVRDSCLPAPIPDPESYFK